MKKTLLLSIFLVFVLGGCFSVQSVNPFSKDKETTEKKEIEIPDDAPSWIEDKRLKNNITALGATKGVDKKEINLHKRKALLVAGNNLLKRVYVKTVNIYKNYVEKLDNPNVFDKDIKKFAEHISLKALTKSKIKNSWISQENELFVQIAVDSDIVAQEIQHNAKLLFETNKTLYHNLLSNRAEKDIIEELEKED